jgi:hypothetical protein
MWIMTKTYNGWTNYETWNVKLWIDNEEGSYNYWREVAREELGQASADAIMSKEERAAWELSKRLEDEFSEGKPDLGASCWADLLNAALSEVDWSEIATAMIGDIE